MKITPRKKQSRVAFHNQPIFHLPESVEKEMREWAVSQVFDRDHTPIWDRLMQRWSVECPPIEWPVRVGSK